jgi:hypothetical protein
VKKKLLDVLRFSLFMGIGLFFIWLFMRNLSDQQKQEIFQSFKLANYYWLLVAFVLGIFSHLLRAARWKILIEPLGYKPRGANVFMAVMIGYLANLALPRLGEVSRCGILSRYEKIPFNKSFGTVITERVIDMLTFVLLFVIMIFTQSGKIQNYINQKIYAPVQRKFSLELMDSGYLTYLIIGLIVAGILSVWLVHRRFRHTRFFRKLYHLMLGFLEGMRSLVRIRKPLLFIVYTLLIWIMYLLMAYVVFFSLNETSHLGLDAGLAVLVFGSVGIMIVQGGIGIYPAIVAETLFLWNVPETKGYALGWLIWASQTIMIVVAGIFSLVLLPTYNRSNYDKSGNHPTKNFVSVSD